MILRNVPLDITFQDEHGVFDLVLNRSMPLDQIHSMALMRRSALTRANSEFFSGAATLGDGDVLRLTPFVPPLTTIAVSDYAVQTFVTFSGLRSILLVDLDMTVATLKKVLMNKSAVREKLLALEGFVEGRIKFYIGGRTLALEEDHSLFSYNIQANDTIRAVYMRVGGMPKKGTKKSICKMERLAVMRARVQHQSTLIQDRSNMAMLNNLASPEFSTHTIGQMVNLEDVIALKTVADSVTRGDLLAKAIMPTLYPQITIMKQQKEELDKAIKGAEQAFELGFSEKFCTDAGFEVQHFYDMFEARITTLRDHAAQQAAQQAVQQNAENHIEAEIQRRMALMAGAPADANMGM